MEPSCRFCLVLHNHQPIGNFDHVFEQAYRDSYLPFLDVFEPFTDLQISLHTSGPLMEWLDAHHPEYIDRLAQLVRGGRVEILGGAYYEPILAMIPSRDRIGQITSYTQWLEARLGGTVRGMWIPERVWEQNLTLDIAAAGIQYTVLDDFHFRNAGMRDDQLEGYYITEEEGNLLSVFPGSERLRYLIPFGQPQETIDYLREVSRHRPGAVVVFGDDGEKFGTWPGTKRHVYESGWLEQFFQGLADNGEWLQTVSMADAIEHVPPLGKIYLPDASYREMTEWALPVNQQLEMESIVRDFENDGRWSRIQPFLRGGFWRNFKSKYPESNVMYSRMMMISRRLQQAEQDGESGEFVDAARRELYRAQCNCSYWHGAFGGIYLPHLRNAVFNHLIAADNLLDQAEGRDESTIEINADDFNFDARQEVQLVNRKLNCLLSPAVGGHLYELDVRSICHNVLATIMRRPEAYHRRVIAGANHDSGAVASIHDRVVFKQPDLDQRLQYDQFPRNCLVDHFLDDQATLESISRGEYQELGDFAIGVYEAKLRRNPDRVQVRLTRSGTACDTPVAITKAVTMQAADSSLEITYLLEGLPQDRAMHFAIEWNFGGLPAGADDRYFVGPDQQKLGQLGTRLDLSDIQSLALLDHWLGIGVRWSADRPSGVWTYPVETVSQSEGGFELVHQAVALIAHWYVQGDADGRWGVTMHLDLDTSLAESRMESSTAAATC